MYRYGLIFLVGAALLLTAVAPLLAENTCPTNVSLEDGAAAFDAHRYAEAISLYSCLLDDEPENAEAYLWRGRALLLNGNWFAAMIDYDAADLYMAVTEQVWDQQERDSAQMISADPEDITGYVIRAHWFWYANVYDQALLNLERILEIDPNNVFALTYRGSTRMMLGLDGAEADWATALELMPDNPEIYEVIGPTNRWVGNGDDSLEYLNRGIEVAPNFPYLYESRALLYASREEYALALADNAHAVELGLEPTENVVTLAEMGRMQLLLNRTEDAAVSFEQAEATMPGSAWVSYWSGTAFNDAGYSEEAGDAYLTFINRLPVEHHQEEALAVGDARTMLLGSVARSVYEVPVDLVAGQRVRVEVSGFSTNVDPLMVLVTPEGRVAVANDNAETSDTLDALIDGFVVPEDGRYTLWVASTFYSATGGVRVNIRSAE